MVHRKHLGLSDRERRLVEQCLRAAVEGPFFPDWEFHTLFGRDRTEVAAVLAEWSTNTPISRTDSVAVNNALVNLLWYPHGLQDRWSEFIDGTPDEVYRVLAKWRGAAPPNYFEALE